MRMRLNPPFHSLLIFQRPCGASAPLFVCIPPCHPPPSDTWQYFISFDKALLVVVLKAVQISAISYPPRTTFSLCCSPVEQKPCSMKSSFLFSQQKKKKQKNKMIMGSKLLPVLLCFGLTVELASMVYASEVSVEGAKMENRFGVWVVAGKVRNLEKNPIRGFVRIKFIDANRNVIKSANAFVTSRDSLAPGQAAPFELWTNFRVSAGEPDFEIDFVEWSNLISSYFVPD